jgi:phosphoglucomutase
MDYRVTYEKWLGFNGEIRTELEGLSEKEIEDRFYRELEFGTGGLRGVIGAGTNRMNKYTVGKATQGFANYILKQKIENPSVAIAYDSRRFSEEFAREVALVFNANGIKSYIYKELKPTPMLSFAVRNLKASAGIVITASHNPKEYNGYKAYWNDGGQVTEEHADGILAEIGSIDYSDIKSMELTDAINEGLFNYILDAVEDEYIKLVMGLVINKEIIKKVSSEIKIIYTPIHGTGNKPVRRALKEAGFENVVVVKEQELPDGLFPTTKYPNPEDPEVFKLALEMAKTYEPDLILGTDPDCDRVGVVVKNNIGEYVVLTGNQTGILLTNYMLGQLIESSKLPVKPVVIKTIVTSELTRRVCDNYGVAMIDVLTGFKYIGEKIKEYEESGEHNFIIGFEESYGYLAGTFTRDKDGVVACTLIAEMAAYYKSKGMNLYDGLIEIYKKYGFYKEGLKSITLPGIEGTLKIKSIMDGLRNNTPKEISGFKVVKLKDYDEKIEKDCITGREADINLPRSNVIQLFLKDGSLVTARPSGTEPKIKFYFATVGKDNKEAEEKLVRIEKDMMELIK